MMRARVLVVLRFVMAVCVLALLAVPSDAHAQAAPTSPQSLPERPASYVWKQTTLNAAFSYRDVIDAEMAKKMSSGVTMVIAMRAYVFESGSNDVVALSIRECKVAYDLWDDIYRIRISSSGGSRASAATTVDGVLRQCAEVTTPQGPGPTRPGAEQPIVDRSLLQPNKSYFLGVLVEVNPFSQQMLDEMRRWVSRPGGTTTIGPGDALFGSFAGLFVRQIGNADRTIRFKTPVFVLPPPAPP